MKTNPLLKSCVFSLYLLILICAAFQINASACTTPLRLNDTVWKPGAQVTVVFDNSVNFSQEEKNAMQQAAANWNTSNGASGNNSGVVFNGFTSGPPPNPGAVNVLFITRQPLVPGHGAQTQNTTNINSPHNTAISTITINQDVNLPYLPDLTMVMAHEIGHTFGLDDCYPACNGSSVMGAQYAIRNADGSITDGVLGPTDCDNTAVNQYNNYSQLLPCDAQEMNACFYGDGVWDSTNCLCNYNYGGGGGGGGGGGYCTPYYWVWFQSWDDGETWEVIDIEYAGCW